MSLVGKFNVNDFSLNKIYGPFII